MSYSGYCLKEKKTMQIINPQMHKTKNNRYIISGTCSNGHKVNRFVSNKEAQGSGLLGNLLGVGDIPLLSSLPLVGGLF